MQLLCRCSGSSLRLLFFSRARARLRPFARARFSAGSRERARRQHEYAAPLPPGDCWLRHRGQRPESICTNKRPSLLLFFPLAFSTLHSLCAQRLRSAALAVLRVLAALHHALSSWSGRTPPFSLSLCLSLLHCLFLPFPLPVPPAPLLHSPARSVSTVSTFSTFSAVSTAAGKGRCCCRRCRRGRGAQHARTHGRSQHPETGHSRRAAARQRSAWRLPFSPSRRTHLERARAHRYTNEREKKESGPVRGHSRCFQLISGPRTHSCLLG